MSEPVDVYPYPEIKAQPNSSHSTSNGSYGRVFIVLGAIFAISVVSCVVGRLFNRRRHRNKEAAPAHNHHSHQVHHQPPPQPPKAIVTEQNRELGPKEWEAKEKPRIALRERADDVEFGFNRRAARAPSARVASYGGGMAEPPRFDGGRRPEVRFADNV